MGHFLISLHTVGLLETSGVAPLLAFEKKFFCIDFMLTNAVNGGSANANFANIASTQLCFLFNAS